MADCGFWNAEFTSEFNSIVNIPIRNLQSEIQHPLTPTLHKDPDTYPKTSQVFWYL